MTSGEEEKRSEKFIRYKYVTFLFLRRHLRIPVSVKRSRLTLRRARKFLKMAITPIKTPIKTGHSIVGCAINAPFFVKCD